MIPRVPGLGSDAMRRLERIRSAKNKRFEETAMTDRGRVRTWVLAVAGLSVAGAATLGVRLAFSTKVKIVPGSGRIAVDAKSSLPQLSQAIARGDGMALAVLKSRLEEKPLIVDPLAASLEAPLAMTEKQAEEWADILASLRVGFSRFSAYGRASAVVVTSEILHKFDAAPAPAGWVDVLRPSSEVFNAALVDQMWDVRAAALGKLKGFWTWGPRRDLFRGEVDLLSRWKESLLSPVAARLVDHDTRIRRSAVACLGTLPLNAAAEPAVRLLSDPEGSVRFQVLISFADRPTLLTEEAILPLLYDLDPDIPAMAERILKIRGLTPEMIGLGKLIVHSRPEMRVSAIPSLKDRQDIDPAVWLIYLSRDSEESVRLKAIEALANRMTPEAKRRLLEMADTDTSKAVREAAEKLLPEGESTATLPPLPASTGAGLKLKAN
jgi:hypothetical protein